MRKGTWRGHPDSAIAPVHIVADKSEIEHYLAIRMTWQWIFQSWIFSLNKIG